MKKINQALIAKKYADAFLNVFIDQLSLEHFRQVCAIASFLCDHRHFLFFLSIPILDDDIKRKVLYKLIESFHLGRPFRKLIDLLAANKRLFLLHNVFKATCMLYKKRKNIEVFTITTSHSLNEDERRYVIDFLAKNTGKTILHKNALDASLIAGIRLQSDAYLWEYSIRKQLRMARDSFMH